MSGAFEASPEGLRRAGEAIGGLPGRARKVREDFIADIANYRGLNGYSLDDEFYAQVEPQFDANNDSLAQVVLAFEDSFRGLQSAVFGNRREIVSTQEDASDLIRQQSSKLDEFENGEDGRR